ncbi:MAG: hypothetical protein ACREUW_01220 [Burkholderiales bacterium]
MLTLNDRFHRALRVAACTAVIAVLAGCGPKLERQDFTTAVMSKSDAEVQKAIGKPDAVDASNPDRVVWTYTSVTFSLANGNKMDAKDQVIFARNPSTGNLTVAEVKFE